MKYMRRTAGYTWTDYKTNIQITKELKITPILVKLLEYKRNWIQHVNRMPPNRLPRVMKHYYPTGRRNHGRPLKRLLGTWDWNGSTSGPTPLQIYDDDTSHSIYDAINVMKSGISSWTTSHASHSHQLRMKQVPSSHNSLCTDFRHKPMAFNELIPLLKPYTKRKIPTYNIQLHNHES